MLKIKALPNCSDLKSNTDLITSCLKLFQIDFMLCPIRSKWWLSHLITTSTHFFQHINSTMPLRYVNKYLINWSFSFIVDPLSFYPILGVVSSLLVSVRTQTPYWLSYPMLRVYKHQPTYLPLLMPGGFFINTCWCVSCFIHTSWQYHYFIPVCWLSRYVLCVI